MSNGPEEESTRYYSNFSNPFGLAIRLLSSGNIIAYQTLAREIVRPLLSPVDRLLQSKESKLLADAKEIKLPMLFIVGSPRSGSTLLYLVLANALDVSWFPNISQMFTRSPITVAERFARTEKKPFKLANFFGNTPGLSLPNDGFSIWNRWHGNNRYIPRISAESIEPMRAFMSAWMARFEKPLLNKNNRNTLCIRQLSEVFPTAHFVVINRDTSDTARSLVRARQFVQGSKHRAWGLLSHSTHKDDELGYIDDVCDQISEIRDQMNAGISAIDPDRVTKVSYEDLCREPVRIVNLVGSRSGVSVYEEGFNVLRTITKPGTQLLSEKEERRLSECLVQID